jgi:hypothetical protein
MVQGDVGQPGLLAEHLWGDSSGHRQGGITRVRQKCDWQERYSQGGITRVRQKCDWQERYWQGRQPSLIRVEVKDREYVCRT